MAQVLPTHARVVVIGGGVAVASVAYHLVKLGWKGIVLLERKQLTSGTIWHAAGLIGQLRANSNITKLAKYSQELYRGASMARGFGVEVEEICASEVKNHYPHVNIDDVKGAIYLPQDGQGDPTDIAVAMTKGARQMGAPFAI